MNNKGFTLVELLVTVAILGIISGISIPLIKNIQYQQRIKQFETYKTNMISSAKLYNSSYSIDLFGKRRSGCAIITYNDLKEKKLLKDIKIKNTNCGKIDSTTGINESYVMVTKYLDNYYYNAKLVCHSGSNIVYPKDNNALEATCPGNGEGSINAFASPSIDGDYSSKEINDIKVYLSSATGYSVKTSNKPKVEYLFTTSESLQDSDYNGDWKSFSFGKAKSEEDQLNIIKSGNPVIYNLGKVNVANFSGEVYLYVRVKKIYNLGEEEWTPGEGWTFNNDYNYKKIGTYRIDNEKPVVDITDIESTNNSYNTLKANLITSANDTYTPTNQLKMCTSLDSNACTTKSKFTNPYISPKEITFGGGYDGSNHTAYVGVMDKAGNISTVKSRDYQVTKCVDIILHKNDGTGKTAGPYTYCIGYNTNRLGYSANGSYLYDNEYQFGNWNHQNEGNSILGWSTNKNSTTASYFENDITKRAYWYVTDSFINDNSNKEVNLYAIYHPTTAYIYYSANGGTPVSPVSISSTTTHPDGTPYYNAGGKITWTTVDNVTIDGENYNDVVYGQYDIDNSNWPLIDSIAYGDKTYYHGSGLTDYNWSGFLLIQKGSSSAPHGAEWKCITNHCQGKTYSEDKTDYVSTDFCKSNYDDCSVVLSVNW